MFENPRRGRQTRNFTTNVPKILDLKSASRTDIFRKLTLGATVPFTWYKTGILGRKSRTGAGPTKGVHNFKWWFPLFFLSQCGFCFPICWFCTTWMETCKEPILYRKAEPMLIAMWAWDRLCVNSCNLKIEYFTNFFQQPLKVKHYKVGAVKLYLYYAKIYGGPQL